MSVHLDTSKMTETAKKLNPHLFSASETASTEPRSQNLPPLAQTEGSTAKLATKVRIPKKKTRTEAEYEAMLKKEYPDAIVLFERYTLKLSNNCRYTPDFCVIHGYGSPQEFHECKGAYLYRGASKSATHTSLTKPKLAAENFPWHRFFVAKKDESGNWTREEYKAAT